jgi:hypothetical protein
MKSSTFSPYAAVAGLTQLASSSQWLAGTREQWELVKVLPLWDSRLPSVPEVSGSAERVPGPTAGVRYELSGNSTFSRPWG